MSVASTRRKMVKDISILALSYSSIAKARVREAMDSSVNERECSCKESCGKLHQLLS